MISKFEFETEDIDRIAKRVSEILLPELIKVVKGQDEERIFNVKELANYLRMSQNWVYKAVESDSIPYIKFTKSLRFKKSEIDRWLEKYHQPQVGKARTKHISQFSNEAEKGSFLSFSPYEM